MRPAQNMQNVRFASGMMASLAEMCDRTKHVYEDQYTILRGSFNTPDMKLIIGEDAMGERPKPDAAWPSSTNAGSNLRATS